MVHATAAALSLLAAAPCMTAAAKVEEPPPPTFDASSIEVDYKTHMTRLKDVTITYGKMTMRADRALTDSIDFKNSHWTFAGDVRINAEPRGNLRSDQAVVEFENNQLKRATATGNPAEFDQKRADSNIIARGHADQIVYDVGPDTIRLSDNAWVTDGRNDIHSPVIVYNLRDEKVEATTSSGTDTRVHVTIAPNEAPKVDGSNKPKAPPADQSKGQSAPPQAGAAGPGTPHSAPPPAAQPSAPQ
jgi:lipopolysaccharide transport protein LptA